ncbi:hypothetical protein [Streptomyces graminilatus]|uniref:hypothetical protein n=1 Tax=Streptomyces graminilatus TaxID=1464070 RepID=UPI0006E28D37|nr:hypothetical protein [Streptomyces graminilatus]
MRTRALTAALSGGLALAAVSAPAAQASPTSPTVITSVVVNGGKPIVVGTTGTTVTATVTGTNDSGIGGGGSVFLWHSGSDYDHRDAVLSDPASVCSSPSATGTCTSKIPVIPALGGDLALNRNSLAGTWHIGAVLYGNNHVPAFAYDYAKIKVLRQSQLTADATPEPVKKGKTITVSGKLSRADWATAGYGGYGAQSVALQFEKKGSSSFTTVKTVVSGASGTVKTTVKASVDGSYRFVFAADSSTSGIASAADFVDVK